MFCWQVSEQSGQSGVCDLLGVGDQCTSSRRDGAQHKVGGCKGGCNRQGATVTALFTLKTVSSYWPLFGSDPRFAAKVRSSQTSHLSVAHFDCDLAIHIESAVACPRQEKSPLRIRRQIGTGSLVPRNLHIVTRRNFP